MKSFEQVFLESCTKIIYSETKGKLTEGIQVVMIQNLYSEGIKDWFLSKCRKLKRALYYNRNRRELTNAAIDTFYTRNPETGKIELRPEISKSDLSNTDNAFYKRLVKFASYYNKTRDLNIFKRFFNGIGRLSLDGMTDTLIQSYAKNKASKDDGVDILGHKTVLSTPLGSTKMFKYGDPDEVVRKYADTPEWSKKLNYGGRNVITAITRGNQEKDMFSGYPRDDNSHFASYQNNKYLGSRKARKHYLKNKERFTVTLSPGSFKTFNAKDKK